MHPLQPIPHNDMRFSDRFWAPRIKTNARTTLWKLHREADKTGRLDVFRLSRKALRGRIPHIFWDSDVAKWVEALAYSVAYDHDPKPSRLLERTVDLIVSAQQKDGHLNTYFALIEPKKRFTNLRENHELYCAGHLMEAAV